MTGRADGRHAGVIRAGAAGLCTAPYVLQDGWRVTVLDPEKPGSGAPGGNAGLIVVSIVTPVAMPAPGRAPRHGNVCFALGRCHVGPTCAAASGKAAADMAAGGLRPRPPLPPTASDNAGPRS